MTAVLATALTEQLNCESAKRLANAWEMRTGRERVGYILELLYTEQPLIISADHRLKLKKLVLYRKPDTGLNISLLLRNLH